MDVAEVLEAAADVLFVRGRCFGQGADAQGRVCVRGALNIAQGLEPGDLFGIPMRADVDALDRYLYAHPELVNEHVYETHAGQGFFEDRMPAWIWNDTTHGPEGDELVIDTLRRCAKEIRNAQGCCPSDPQATDGSVAA